MGWPEAADVNTISHTIPNFWSEDIDGFFAVFEGPCVNKNITQDGTKYSKLLSVLMPAACTRMVGHLPEPGTAVASYDTLNQKLKSIYTKTDTQRCTEMLSIVSLGDRDPEHLLSYIPEPATSGAGCRRPIQNKETFCSGLTCGLFLRLGCQRLRLPSEGV